MAFSKRSKLLFFAGVLSQAVLSGLAVARQPAAAHQQAIERRGAMRPNVQREEAILERDIQRLELELRAMRLELELKRVHLQQLRLRHEPAEGSEAGLERSHGLDGHGWRVDAHGIIRDRSWRPVGDWGVDDAIGLWGIDDDGLSATTR